MGSGNVHPFYEDGVASGHPRGRLRSRVPARPPRNLLEREFATVDSHELRLLLDERIGRPGQYDGARNKLYLPLARGACRVALTFTGDQITRIEPGPAFDERQWQDICDELRTSIVRGPRRVARE